MTCPVSVAGGDAAPPETDLRRERRAHFAGFEGQLTPAQRRVVELHYVGGRHGRSRKGPARDRVLLHKALRRLAEAGVELELPPPTWGTNGTEVWVDDDQITSRCCDRCGGRYAAALVDGCPGKAWPPECPTGGRTEAQERAHGARRRPRRRVAPSPPAGHQGRGLSGRRGAVRRRRPPLRCRPHRPPD